MVLHRAIAESYALFTQVPASTLGVMTTCLEVGRVGKWPINLRRIMLDTGRNLIWDTLQTAAEPFENKFDLK